MNLEAVVGILKELDIETDQIALDTLLGPELGMDSQEIVELVSRLNQKFGLVISKKALSKKSCIRDVLTAGTVDAPIPTPSGHCEASLVFDCSVESAYQGLFALQEWTRYLPHVREVEVLYDDGRFQEFIMHVQSPTGMLRVRSVRRCIRAKSIEFFQPEPPRYLKNHSGGWEFRALSPTQCEVRTYHNWKPDRAIAASTFGACAAEQDRKIAAVLLEHAKLALACWKQALETPTATAAPILPTHFSTRNESPNAVA